MFGTTFEPSGSNNSPTPSGTGDQWWIKMAQSRHFLTGQFSKNKPARYGPGGGNGYLVALGGAGAFDESWAAITSVILYNSTVVAFYTATNAAGDNSVHYAEASSVRNGDAAYTKGAAGPLFPSNYLGGTRSGWFSVCWDELNARWVAIMFKDSGLAGRSIYFMSCPGASDPRIQANWTNHGLIYSLTAATQHGLATEASPVMLIDGAGYFIYFSSNLATQTISCLYCYGDPTVAANWVSQGTVITASSAGRAYSPSVFYINGQYWCLFRNVNGFGAGTQQLEIKMGLNVFFSTSFSPPLASQPAIAPSGVVGAFDQNLSIWGLYFPYLNGSDPELWLYVSGAILGPPLVIGSNLRRVW